MDLEIFKVVLLIIMTVFSISSFIFLYSERKAVRKREVAFKLYDKWSGDKIQEYRTIAWNYFESLEENIKIDKTSDCYKTVVPSLIAIEHHLYDVRASCEQDMVDLKILNSLCGESMSYYLKKLDNHVIGGIHGDKDLYEKRIKTLEDYFHSEV